MQEAVAGIAPIKLRMQQVKASENAATIARYQRPIALEEVQQAVDSLTLEAEMTVEEIILIRETRAYGQQYTVAERIPLH
ncbi:MAG: hypothetical protein K0S68_777 [Candidatus Saccharibacteria bacterium]|nr:hypothetical protein [Candidatus Saccharibacteria bacterium]